MTASRSIFYGFSSYIGSQTGTTSCTWWPGDPASFGWDTSKEIANDLAKNPTACRAGHITAAQIQVDDFSGGAPPNAGGENKIGPTFPGGATIGGCWLESNYYAGLAAAIKPVRVPKGMPCFDYELTSVLYWNGPMVNRRFYGFYAHIQSESGPSALLSVWAAGTSQAVGMNPQGTWWLNLATVAHPIEAGFTAIGVGTYPKTGAIFLDGPTCISLSLFNPKLPPAQGSSYLPRSEK
jgi:hypothetical protein